MQLFPESPCIFLRPENLLAIVFHHAIIGPTGYEALRQMSRTGKESRAKVFPREWDMELYMAPLEGITGSLFRNVYQAHFPGFDRFFTPFFGNTGFNTKELCDIGPDANQGMPLVPQILSNKAEDFLQIAQRMKDYGYTSVNLNLGCPSGTVTGKGRGSGFLRDPKALDAFFAEIAYKSPLPISVKTRIGYEDESLWPEILAVYNRYPVTELIVHPRLKTDMYRPGIRMDAFAYAYENANMPLVYNGDINTVEDYRRIVTEFPNIRAVMIGRGILRNPGLIGEIHGAPPADNKAIREWLDDLMKQNHAAYTEIPTLFKLKEIWTYLQDRYPEHKKELKQLFKAKKLNEYKNAAAVILQ